MSCNSSVEGANNTRSLLPKPSDEKEKKKGREGARCTESLHAPSEVCLGLNPKP